MSNTTQARPAAASNIGILFILIGMFAISVNDMLIKQLSGAYPLHQMVFIRSVIGIAFSLTFVWFEGGLSLLRTRYPVLHLLRGLVLVISNMTFFVALAVIPLANATALFFAAPLFITLLSIPLLGEKVGPLRIGAVVVGFIGVIIMQRPWAASESLAADRIVLLLPVVSAFCYALMQIMTRKLGASTKASALAVYIQSMFIVVSLAFFVISGDGRYLDGVSDPGLRFLLRPWVWPSAQDWPYFIALGVGAGIIGYALSQAYRMSDAALIAPFEYVGLPLAVMWGWLFWAEIPAWEVWIGMTLIAGAGVFVFLREHRRSRRTSL